MNWDSVVEPGQTLPKRLINVRTRRLRGTKPELPIGGGGSLVYREFEHGLKGLPAFWAPG